MLNILIAGCGNIGSRHLQSLKLTTTDLRIFVYDPFNPSLEKAKGIWESTSGTKHEIHFITSLETLPNTIFTCIIATNSANRLEIFKLIAENFTVKHFVLEKFLFPIKEEYDIAQTVIDQIDSTILVNCPRRLFTAYQFLKSEIKGSIKSVEIKGNNWGLCSNAIHFIDLLNYLSNELPTKGAFNTSMTKIIPSKRDGYLETLGQFTCDFPSFKAQISCNDGDFSGIEINIISEDSPFKITEINSIISIFKSDEKLHESKMKFQSELTATYIENLNTNKQTGLTQFVDSCPMHLLFLNAVQDLVTNLNYKNEWKIS